MFKIDSLDKNDTINLLSDLKNLQRFKKDLWNKWITLFKKALNWEKTYIVEYDEKLDLDFVWETSYRIYLDVFKQNPQKQDIVYKKSWDLIWGIRVYSDDKMVDLSYLNILNKLQK